MCVQYKVGDPLPHSISVVDFDKSNVEVKVTYLNKPLICTHCKSLGHLINVCPIAKREWVRKVPKEVLVKTSVEPRAMDVTDKDGGVGLSGRNLDVHDSISMENGEGCTLNGQAQNTEALH